MQHVYNTCSLHYRVGRLYASLQKNKAIALAATKPEIPHQNELDLFPTILATRMSRLVCNNQVFVSLSEPLEFTTKSTDTAFTTKPTYKYRVIYRISVLTMHTTNFLLSSDADINPVRSSIIPPCWTNCIKRRNVLQLRIATRQLPPFNWLDFHHLRLDDLSTHIWFAVASRIALGILPDTAFIDRFIPRIFLLECKVVFPWHSQVIAKLAHKQTLQDTRISNNV